MHKFVFASLGILLVGSGIASAQVAGPARRAATAAADAAGAPGVLAIASSSARKTATPLVRTLTLTLLLEKMPARTPQATVPADRWRYKYHNNQWWYYTPNNAWMYHRNSQWNNYDAATYSNPRYQTGYRGDESQPCL